LPPGDRLEATAAAVTAGVLAGADFVRVHDVQSMVRVVKIADAIRNDRGLKRP
jgi:dihydropteroate synthase